MKKTAILHILSRLSDPLHATNCSYLMSESSQVVVHSVKRLQVKAALPALAVSLSLHGLALVSQARKGTAPAKYMI